MEVAFMRDSDTWQAFPIKKKLIFVTLKKPPETRRLSAKTRAFALRGARWQRLEPSLTLMVVLVGSPL
jgi:hypothetical protein